MRTRPEDVEAVCCAIASLEDVEVHHAERGYVILVIEGDSARMLGDKLTELSLLDGVLGASMVYEQACDAHELAHEIGGEDP